MIGNIALCQQIAMILEGVDIDKGISNKDLNRLYSLESQLKERIIKATDSLILDGETYKKKNSPFYVHRNSGGVVFVKEGSFFESQGGLVEPWGQAWTRVWAESLDEAVRIGEERLPK